jgi:hypothetical protein
MPGYAEKVAAVGHREAEAEAVFQAAGGRIVLG